ncbi:MAG: ABC transporter permease [Pseudomonadota bacterium]
MPPSADSSALRTPLWRRLAARNEAGLAIALVVIIAFFSVSSEYFLSPINITNVLGQASLAMIAGVGVAMVFISGEVDISIGSILAAAAIPMIEIMNLTGSMELGILAALALGLAIGAINGFLSAYAGINSLIVTLGTLFVLRGAVYLYTGKTAIPDRVYLDSFFEIGNGRFFGLVPYPAIIALVTLVVFIYVLTRRRFGRKVYAVGGNAEVARLAGFDVKRVKFTCFVISGALASVAGILLASRVGSAQYVAGAGFEFQVVAAVVLGGVSLAGGIGSLVGMALGVLVLAFVANGLGMLNVNTEWQLVITGLVIIAAVAFDEWKRRTRSAGERGEHVHGTS